MLVPCTRSTQSRALHSRAGCGGRPADAPRASWLCARLCVAALAALLAGPAVAQPAQWTVNGKEMPLTEFISQVAEITGKTIVVGPRAKNQMVTVISDVGLDADSVYALFLTVLKVNALGAVEYDGVVSVQQQPAIKQSGGPVSDGVGEPPDRLVTRVLQLEHVQTVELVKVLRSLMPQSAHIAAIAEPNVLIMADYASNMVRLMQLVEQIDVVDTEEIVVRPLEHAWVGSVGAVLQELDPQQFGPSASGPRQVQIVANERNNSLVLKGKPHAVAQALLLIDKLDVEETTSIGAQVIHLNNADAATVAELLNNLVNDGGTTGGSAADAPVANILADESLNALIVRADPTTMNQLLGTVKQLDVRREQVLIEAAIVEVSVNAVDSVGVELAVGDAGGEAVPLATTTLNGIIGPLIERLGLADGSFDPVAALSASASPTLAVAKLNKEGVSFGAVVNALLTDTRANLLSTPSVLTLDNEEASQVAGQQIPFRTGSFTTTTDGASNPFQTINRENVGVELTVTPHIHADRSIRMSVSLSVGNVVDAAGGGLGVGAAGFADVVTNERKLETTILADDRQIILLGGLIQDDFRDVGKRVPLVSRIPVLGHAFRSQSQTLVKRQLLMFLRPTIMLSGDEAAQTALERYDGIYRLKGETDANIPPAELESVFESRADE